MRRFYKNKPGFGRPGPPQFGGKKKFFGKPRGGGKPFQGGRGGGGRTQLPPMSSFERQIYKKALGLQTKLGIPFDDAFEIAARGTNISIKKFKVAPQKTKLEELCTTYRLPRSLAGNVVSGNITLEKAVLRNELRRSIATNKLRSCLIDAKESAQEITLAMFGGKSMTGIITELEPYAFKFKKTPKTKRPTKEAEFLKLNAKFGYPPMFEKYVAEKIQHDAELKAKDLKPPKKVIERRMVKNEKLQRFQMSKAPILVKTYEGDMFTGVLSWWGQYELGLDIGNGVVVTMFRHALYLVYQPG